MSLNILYDNQIFNRQRFGGISRYFSELIKSLKDDPDYNVIQQKYYSDNIHLKLNNLTSYDKLNALHPFPGKSRIENYISKKELNKIQDCVRKGKFDIYHPTYYASPLWSSMTNDKPLVLTVHDMIHELYLDEKFEFIHPETLQKNVLIPRADHIIAVSENTKKNILSYYPQIKESKISVIYHGTSFSSKPVRHKKLLQERYVLYVGNRKFYKNFLPMLKAISSFLKKEKLILLCAGGGNFDHYETQIIENEQLKHNVIYHEIINDTDLEDLYSNAICFIFPSLYEGFGIPILEAFACGCPVLLSDASCFPEVALDAALYFKSGDDASLLDRLSLLLNKKKIRSDLIDRGHERLKNYSWAKTLDQHKLLYKSLI